MFARIIRSIRPYSTVAETAPVVQTIKLVPNVADMTELEKQDALIEKRKELTKNTVNLKKLKPVSPGLRWYRQPVCDYLYRGRPYYPLTVAKRGNGGRNHHGKITIRHRGGGHKRRLRLVDYYRSEPGSSTIERIEYDPNRTAHVALLKNDISGRLSYILAPDGLRAGNKVESFRNGVPQKLIDEMGGTIDPAILSAKTCQNGNCLPISMIPIGSIVHNIGLSKIGKGLLCRSAGAYARIMQKLPEKNRAVLKLKSGEYRYVPIDAPATLGIVSNVDHQHRMLGKAGRSRWRGWRPTVRGLAMNKVDHPHGGGRGKKKSNKLSMSPWGQLAKGYKTRRGKNVNRMKVRDRPRGRVSRRSSR